MNSAQDIQNTLSRWCEEITKALEGSLQAIILFGGLAKDEFVPDQSDVNILILLRKIDVSLLDRAAPFVRQGQLEFGLSAMLMTEADLCDAADVFPIKFLDMQRRHKMLWGQDPFSKVTVTRENLRLRCEQELRNLSLRLRQGYIQSIDRPEQIENVLGRAVSSLLVNIGVLLEMETGKPVETKLQALENAAALGLPVEPLRLVWALKRGELEPDTGRLKKLFADFMEVVNQTADLAGKCA